MARSPWMMSSSPVVEVEGLGRSYGSVRAVDGVSFTVNAGQVVAFLGPNGAGKTTVMKILTGYLAADEGSARICGIDVEQDPIAAKQLVGYLPENNPLYLDQRVGDFLGFVAGARGLTGAVKRTALEQVVAATSIEEVWGRFIGHCSKGFRQRVGFAQALLHDPPLLILDEPTNGLDPLQVVEMRELVRTLGKTKTVILTSHVLPEVEALADRVIMITQGRIAADGILEELLGSSNGNQALRLKLKNCTGGQASGLVRKALEAAGLELESIESTGDNLEDLFRRITR